MRERNQRQKNREKYKEKYNKAQNTKKIKNYEKGLRYLSKIKVYKNKINKMDVTNPVKVEHHVKEREDVNGRDL